VRRLLTLTGAWLAAAIVAAGVAWQGVRLVGDQVTDDRSPSLTQEEIDAMVAAATSEGAGEAADTSATTTPTTSAPTSGGAAPSEPAAEVRAWDLTGGSVSLRFAPSGVTVVYAQPRTGYQVRSQPSDGGGMRVEFDGPQGRSRIEGWWDGGPQVEIDDDDADDGGDDNRGGGGDGGGGSGPGGADDSGGSGPG
jgi:hypothetical protein